MPYVGKKPADIIATAVDTTTGTFSGDVAITGTTPTLTIGDGGAEDTAIVFDGNEQNFYIGLDDTNDNLSIGLGSTVGSTQLIKMTSGDVIVNEDSADINFRVEGNADATLFKVDAGEDNVKIKTDNNYAALVIENDDAGSQERALYASVTATSGTSASNVALFSATHSNMTNPLVRIHHEDPSADQLLIQATTTGSNTVKFSVDEDGDIYSAGGINLGGTGTANKLDDYEEGTWTPSLVGLSNTPSFHNNVGRYTKIGRVCTVQFFQQTNVNPTFSTGTDEFKVGGLPFTVDGSGYSGSQGSVLAQAFNYHGSNNTQGVTGSGSNGGAYLSASVNSSEQMQFHVTNSGGTRGIVNNNGAAQGYIIEATVTYFTSD
jgi:hypothetical protein